MLHKGRSKRKYEKKNPKRKYSKGVSTVGTPPTYLDRVSEAKDALDVAHDLYVDAVLSGNAESIRSARRALMIAIANYLAVTGGEATDSETESTPPLE